MNHFPTANKLPGYTESLPDLLHLMCARAHTHSTEPVASFSSSFSRKMQQPWKTMECYRYKKKCHQALEALPSTTSTIQHFVINLTLPPQSTKRLWLKERATRKVFNMSKFAEYQWWIPSKHHEKIEKYDRKTVFFPLSPIWSSDTKNQWKRRRVLCHNQQRKE